MKTKQNKGYTKNTRRAVTKYSVGIISDIFSGKQMHIFQRKHIENPTELFCDSPSHILYFHIFFS